jgi:HNH endonuclease
LEQCRADALVDLMLTNVSVATTVSLMIPVQTVTVEEPQGSRERDLLAREGESASGGGAGGGGAGAQGGAASGSRSWCEDRLAATDDFGQPAVDPNPLVEPSWRQICAMGYEIPGIGVIGGDVVAGILEKFDTRIARVLLDERTGVVIETSIAEYRPNRAMRRFIQRRDRTCRFPGCARAARRCEPDHVIPYSRGGPTAIWNLVSICKHHHRVKHNAGWALTMSREGECVWTDPFGRQYATHPVDHHDLAA